MYDALPGYASCLAAGLVPLDCKVSSGFSSNIAQMPSRLKSWFLDELHVNMECSASTILQHLRRTASETSAQIGDMAEPPGEKVRYVRGCV